MLIVSGQYFAMSASQPAFVLLEVETNNLQFPLMLAVAETPSGNRYFLQCVHPQDDQRVVLLDVESVADLRSELDKRFDEIKSKSTNAIGQEDHGPAAVFTA